MSDNLKRRDILKGSITASLGLTPLKKLHAAAPDDDPFPPGKIIKKKPLSYSPLAYCEKVEQETKPRMAFSAVERTQAEVWQKELRDKLWDLLGEHHEPGAVNPPSRLLETKDFKDYKQEKWELDVVDGRSLPFYVLKPKGTSKPLKTALCLHGHGNGARDLINMPANDEGREFIEVLNYDYALQTVKKGWCAVAPDLLAFGERLDVVEGARAGLDGGCEKPFLNAIQCGKTLIGIRAKDACTVIDWLSFREEFDLSHLCCIGLSGGGMMTTYAAALDQRIKRALACGYIAQSRDTILGIRHCSCNYVPGLSQWADIPDVAGLIVPRFLIVQSGVRDGIFPIESVRRAYAEIKKVYTAFNTPENVVLHEHDGFHKFWSPSLDTLLV